MREAQCCGGDLGTVFRYRLMYILYHLETSPDQHLVPIYLEIFSGIFYLSPHPATSTDTRNR